LLLNPCAAAQNEHIRRSLSGVITHLVPGCLQSPPSSRSRRRRHRMNRQRPRRMRSVPAPEPRLGRLSADTGHVGLRLRSESRCCALRACRDGAGKRITRRESAIAQHCRFTGLEDHCAVLLAQREGAGHSERNRQRLPLAPTCRLLCQRKTLLQTLPSVYIPFVKSPRRYSSREPSPASLGAVGVLSLSPYSVADR